MPKNNNLKLAAVWLLRSSLAFSFVYAAMAAFITPTSWVGYLPQFISEIMSRDLALMIWSSGELILAVWIMSGWRVEIPAGITAVALFLMVVFNWGQISILFRDLSLGLAAISLLLLELRPQASPSSKSDSATAERSTDN